MPAAFQPGRVCLRLQGAADVVIGGDGGQKRRKGDLLQPAGLGYGLDLGTEPRLVPKSQLNRLAKRQRLPVRGDRVKGGLVGIAGKRHCRRGRLVGIHAPWRTFECRWQRGRSIVHHARLGSLSWLRGDGWLHACVPRRPAAGISLRLAHFPRGIDVGHDPSRKVIVELGVRMSTSSRQDEPDQPRLAADGAGGVNRI